MLNRRGFLKSVTALPIYARAAMISTNEIQAQEPGSSRVTLSDVTANEKMQQARNVALQILQPTRKQLEHAFELHANTLVIEPYGFAPRAAVDGNGIAAAMASGASDIELQDLSEEMRMTRCVTDSSERQEFVDAWQAAGVTCIFQNAGQEGSDITRLLKRLARFTYVTDMLKPFVSKAVTPDDMILARKQNSHCLYFSGNGVPIPQNWASTEDELRYIRIFYQLGVRMMHLTYNRRNMIGDGCAEKSNTGLSDFGRIVVREMNRVGIIVDVAHSSWQTGIEAAHISEKPIVASHTVCSSVHEHIRAKPDNVIRAICDTGGFIGICCIPRFLGGPGDISAMMDHIDYAVKKFGADHVAIATDVAHTSSRSDSEYEKIPAQPARRTQWEMLWPPDDFETTPGMRQSMAWTNWPLFTVGLVQRGYSDTEIQKILGGNALRVAKAVLL